MAQAQDLRWDMVDLAWDTAPEASLQRRQDLAWTFQYPLEIGKVTPSAEQRLVMAIHEFTHPTPTPTNRKQNLKAATDTSGLTHRQRAVARYLARRPFMRASLVVRFHSRQAFAQRRPRSNGKFMPMSAPSEDATSEATSDQ